MAGKIANLSFKRYTPQSDIHMDLKQFVTETLVQISEGIEEAQRQLKERGSAAIVNTNMTKTDVGHLVTGGRRRPVEYVEFDVAPCQCGNRNKGWDWTHSRITSKA